MPSPRALLPLLPLLCAFGASFIASLARPDPAVAVVLRGGWRIALGALLAALLLALAFGAPLLDLSCR